MLGFVTLGIFSVYFFYFNLSFSGKMLSLSKDQRLKMIVCRIMIAPRYGHLEMRMFDVWVEFIAGMICSNIMLGLLVMWTWMCFHREKLVTCMVNSVCR